MAAYRHNSHVGHPTFDFEGKTPPPPFAFMYATFGGKIRKSKNMDSLGEGTGEEKKVLALMYKKLI